MRPHGFNDDAIAVYDGLLRQALRELRSPESTPGQQIAWSRVAEHALKHLPATEERLADAISTAAGVLDSPEAVRSIVGGVWSCAGCRSNDGTGKRLRRWVVGLAGRAIQGEHWVTFARLAHTASRIDGIEQELYPGWERALRGAHEMPSAWVSLYLLAYHCARRLEQVEKDAPLPDWLRRLRSDERLGEAYRTECSLEDEIQCRVCGRVDP